jgi:hypothetical protein
LKNQKEYLVSDEPQLSVHLVSFTDATLVTFRWPHWQVDAMGMSIILRAWSLVLQGRESEVPPLYGFDFDPLDKMDEPAAGTAAEKYVVGDRQLKGLGLGYFLARYLVSFLLAKDDQRMICVPASHIAALKVTALAELNEILRQNALELDQHKPSITITEKSINGTIDGSLEQKRSSIVAEQSLDEKIDESLDGQKIHDNTKPFLSDGDILCAWWTKLAHLHRSPKSKRKIVIINAFEFRKCFTADLLPPSKGSYIHNATGALFAFIPAGEVVSKPLSHLAAVIRESIVSQGTRNQLTAFAALNRVSVKRTGLAPLIAEPSAKFQVVSNWSKANVFKTDFSAAVIRQGIPVAERTNPLGMPSYAQTVGYSAFLRNLLNTFGQDAEGNFWCSPILRASKWAQVEKSLANLPEMEKKFSEKAE